MSLLFIKGLTYSGVHGSTAREPFDPQRFRVDVEISLDTALAEKTDKLQDTYDYKHARAIVREVIEGKHCVLIETLAARILDHICENPKVRSAKIKIEKLDAAENGGVPGITMERR